MQYTDAKIKEFEKISMNHPAIERTYVAVGGFGAGGQGNRGNGVAILKPRDQRTQSQFEVAAELRKAARSQIKGMFIIVRDRFGGALGGRRGSPIEFTLNGPDPDQQRSYLKTLLAKMKEDPLIEGARSDDINLIPEVHVVPDRKKAAQRGIEVSEIAQVVNSTFGGAVASQYTNGGRRFDIFVQLKEEDRQKATQIEPVLVRNNRGELVSLKTVVDIEDTSGPQQIYREDRMRGLRVDANLAQGAKLGDAITKIKKWSEDLLPKNYFIRFSETPQDKLFDILMIMGLGLLFAYMILAAQFNSFIDPIIVFLAIPFGLTGSLFALILGGQTLNVYSAIGILLTMGIVKKNSILLVEFSNQLRDEGQDMLTAVRTASSVRLRPILMTNLATIAAALPPALALGPGSETRVPMALTVIGGVIVSVIFTLYVVPCVYTLISPKRQNILEEDDSINMNINQQLEI